MIARFRVLLPFEVRLDRRENLEVRDLERDGYRLRIYPPYPCGITVAATRNTPLPVSEIVAKLPPAPNPQSDAHILLNGGPTAAANALQIDVLKEAFLREVGSEDPPTTLLFEVTNSVLEAVRSTSRGAGIHPIEKEGTCWRIEYLGDDANPLPPEPGRARARNGGAISLQATGLTQATWERVLALQPGYRTKAWEGLLLDAEAQLPDIVPAVVLAAAGLEVLIGASMDLVAPTDRGGKELWEFVKDRGDYRKEPSVAEQYDKVLHALTGHSLKEAPTLWEAFRNIRDALNSLMHEGTMTIGGRPVTRADAYDLIARAKGIADWIETLLPAGAHRPSAPTDELQFTIPVLTNPVVLRT